MTSPISSGTTLDLTPAGLFPDRKDAAKDKKCLIISKLMQERAQIKASAETTQSALKTEAQSRYEYLSNHKLLSKEANFFALLLCDKGVQFSTARDYYSFCVNENDRKNFGIAKL